MIPVWRKAPWLLVRSPGVFAALAVGALLIVVTVVAYPLFISASRDRLVEAAVGDPTTTRYGAGITYTATNVRFTGRSPDGHGLLYARREQLFAEATAASAELDAPIEQIRGDEVSVTGAGGQIPASGPVNGALFAGTGVLEHVQILEGTDGPGVWLPDFVAGPLHAHAGDTVELGSGTNVVKVTVDGVYRALYTQPSTGYWRPWYMDIYPCPLCGPPPQPILVDRTQLFALMTALGDLKATFALTAPIRDPTRLTFDQARELQASAASLLRRMNSSGHDADFRSVFRCCGIIYPFSSLSFGGHVTDVEYLTAIPSVVHEVEQRMAAIQGPMLVVVLAGIAISLGVVAAAGLFSFGSRRVEAGVLAARGWGPWRVGAKAMLESTLACLVGGAAGFVLARVAIGAFGPQGTIESSAASIAIVGAIVAVLVSIVLVGLVSALSFVSRHEPREGVIRALLWVPWEVPALWAAYLFARQLGGVVISTGQIASPPAAVFLFPLALSFGVAVLVARASTVVLGRARAGTTLRVSAWYLARRRMASSVRLSMVFLVVVSLALSLFAASRAMVGSLRATVDAKAKVFVGSDVQVQVGRDTQVPRGFAFPATIVTRARQAGYLPGGELQFDLLVVDPSTFASAAYWNDRFADRSLPDLMNLLTQPAEGGLPVIMSNGGASAPATIVMEQRSIPIDVVARTSSFPGTSSVRPVFIVAGGPLSRAFAGSSGLLNEPQDTREMWIRGSAGRVLAAVSQAGIGSLLTITAAGVEDIPFIQATVDTYLVLNVIGLVALILVLVVAVLYLQARQRARVVASALSYRMGLGRGTMRRSLTIELGALLFAGLAIGAATGLVATSVVVPHVDPLSTIPPSPIPVMPLLAVAGAAIFLVVAAFAGGWLADNATRGVRLGEVLRVSE